MTSPSGSSILLFVLVVGCAAAPCPPVAAPAPEPGAPVAAPSMPSALPAADAAPDPHLVGFSQATCLALYLQEKGWDPASARNLAGGYVELGTRSGEAYAALANFIRDYEPPLSTQQPIDKHLLRCFHLEDSAEWQRLVRAQ